MNNIYVLFGPSGCGKNTVASIMEQQFECEKLVTDTTRKPREGEINHIDYNFFTKEEFLRGIENDEYVEYTNYSGNFYGSRKKNYETLLNKGKNIVIIMDIKGVLKLKEIFPKETIAIFIKVHLNLLEDRMKERGDNLDSITKRLDNVKLTNELENEKFADIVLCNEGTIEDLKQQIKQIRED